MLSGVLAYLDSRDALVPSGASPGVRVAWAAKCSWKLDAPGRVPAGALISAGKLGSVDRSLPNLAVSWVNLSPASCMPSPESPANLIMTRSRCWTCLVTVGGLLHAPRPGSDKHCGRGDGVHPDSRAPSPWPAPCRCRSSNY